MASSTRSVNDITRQLGLICVFTGKLRDREPIPIIWKVFKKLDSISYAYRNEVSDLVQAEKVAVGRIAFEFLEPYGEKIWSADGTGRAGLLRAGDRRANGLYPKDLYWDQFEDKARITELFRDLAVAKASKHCKLRAREVDTNDGLNEEESDDDLLRGPRRTRPQPVATTRPPTSSSTLINPDSWVCFASDKGHRDASELKKLGVWLGSEDNHDEVVIQLSFTDLMKQFHARTEGGKPDLLENDQLSTNAYHRGPNPRTSLACASCLSKGRELEMGMRSREIGFQSEKLSRMIWTYPCKLNGRNVFALLKSEKNRHNKMGIRSFWKVEGGYTNDVLIMSATADRMFGPAYENLFSRPTTQGKLTTGPDGEANDGGARLLDDSGDDSEAAQSDLVECSRPSQKQSPPQAVKSEDASSAGPSSRVPGNAFGMQSVSVFAPATPQNKTGLNGRLNQDPTSSRLILQKRRLSTDETDRTSTKRQRKPPQADDAETEDLYNVTPGVEERVANVEAQSDAAERNILPSFEHSVTSSAGPTWTAADRSAASDTVTTPSLHLTSSSHPPERSQAPTTAQTTPAARTSKVNIWCKLAHMQGRRIVSLSMAMTVQEVFVAVQLAFSGELGNETSTNITITLPHDIFEEPIVVARHDEATWNALLDILRSCSSLPASLSGVISA